MKRATEYEAHDGARFTSADECREHEQKIKLGLLTELSMNRVMDAISRSDLELADAIEFAGNLIADKRRTDGDLKRKVKAKLPAQVPGDAPTQTDKFETDDQEAAYYQTSDPPHPEHAKKRRARK
jgi:hypothetical protein